MAKVTFFPKGVSRQARVALAFLEARGGRMRKVSRQIWGFAELGLQEHRSAKVLVEELLGEGFQVETGVAGMPTSFVATYGRGKPVVGILAEYDAVPHCGMKPTENGHGCGHNLFSTASVSGAVAVKAAMEQARLRGTVKCFGTPAEEMLLGKVLMAKAGAFHGLDACLSWHPGASNHADSGSNMAMDSYIFEFFGRTSHAMIDPELGRDALRAVLLMSHSVSTMHLPEKASYHHVIPEGGKVPGVIIPYAKAWYWIWSPERRMTDELSKGLIACARGAALATGTRVKAKKFTGTYHRLPNAALGERLDQNLRLLGAPRFSASEKTYVRRLGLKGPLQEVVDSPLKDYVAPFSNDNANVSWLAPFGMFRTVTRTPDTPEHHKFLTLQAGMGIGQRGMIYAAKVLAVTALDLLTDRGLLGRAQEEFKERTKGFVYRSTV
jgi:aminobenzoyl-glutamate utilization protein B